MACDEGVQLPKYLEELLAELTGPFLQPREEVSTGHVREDTGGITETVKETVKCQELDSNDLRRGSLFDAFVAAGFAWSVRKKRRGPNGGGARGGGGAVAASNGFEPQILWKNDVKGGRPVSKREEIRRKIATPEEAPSRNVPRGSKAMGPRPSSRQTTRLESNLENMIKAATDPASLEITGFDLLGIETTGDLTPTPYRHNTPTPVTPRSRSSRPNTPARETGGSRTECPMLVRSLVPASYSPGLSPEGPGEFFEFPEPQRQLTQESSMELPVEDGFVRVVSCARRGKQRALSNGFLRQISPMLRQISPDRRQVSDSGSSMPLSEFRRVLVRDEPMMGKMQSEPSSSGNELRASELPSSSITFHPRTEVKPVEHDDLGSVLGRYRSLDEEPSLLTSKSSFDKAFSFEDEQSNLQRSTESKELSSEDLDAAADGEAAGDDAGAAPAAALAPEPEPVELEGEVTEAEPGGDAELQPSIMASSSITTEEEPGVYLVPPWALREHLRLESRASTPPLESMDKELQEVVKALQQAPALRSLPPRPRTQSPERPHSVGLVARMRHLVSATPDAQAPAARSGPTAALGTSLLSMSHPSRSTAKVQLQAQSQAMVKSKLPRQATHHAVLTASFASSTEPWRPGEAAEDDVEPQPEALMDGDHPEVGEGDHQGSIPPELSFVEEHFFLTGDDY